MKTSYVLIGIVCIVVILVVGVYSFGDQKQSNVQPDERVHVTIAVAKTPLSAPFYIAQEKGFFEDEGLDMTFVELSGGHKCLVTVLNGETDMGTASDLPTMFNSFKRDDYAVVTTFVKSNNDNKIIARKSNDITAPEDLQGKKIGAVPGSSSQFFLDLFLVMNDINKSEVEIVEIQPENMAFALQSGEVDAISIWEPFGYEASQLVGEDAIIFPHMNIYTETFNLIAMKNYTQSDPEVTERTLRALDKAITFMNSDQNEKEVQDIIIKKLETDQGFIEWIWPDFHFGLSLDQSLLITLEEEARWALKNNMTNETKIPNYLDFMYIDGLDEVKPEVISIIR